MLRIVVLLSGRGSNLAALIEGVHARADVDAEIVGVVSNRPRATGLQRASAAGITAACIDQRACADRDGFEQALVAAITALEPDLLLLAGFMRILSADFVGRFSPRMLNVHPSLLPDLPGLDTHARALARGDREAGASIHVVIPELDSGPVLAQVRVPIEAGDDAASLAARVLIGEHLLYPEVTRWVAEGRLQLDAAHPRLDGRALPASGFRYRIEGDALQPCDS